MSATAAIVCEATMSSEQVYRLSVLMREARPTRPAGVVAAALLVEGEQVQLVAFWKDRTTLDEYLATVDVPRGVELMRYAGVEPAWKIVDVREFA